MTQQTHGTPDLKYSEEAFRDMYEALRLFNVNIDFVNDTNPNKDELLRVLVFGLRKALAKVEGEDA